MKFFYKQNRKACLTIDKGLSNINHNYDNFITNCQPKTMNHELSLSFNDAHSMTMTITMTTPLYIKQQFRASANLFFNSVVVSFVLTIRRVIHES
jgi:hypothetical protein